MPFSKDEIDANLEKFPDWLSTGSCLQKTFELKDFQSALAFVVKIGLLAEKFDHHPDILLHSWNKVRIELSTHSEGGITKKDFRLAAEIESLL